MSDTMNIRRVAGLTKLSLSPEEETRLASEMEGILAFAQQLQQLDLTDVPQTQHIFDRANVMRKDEIHASLLPETLLSAAPSCEREYITVPRTVE